MFTCIHTIKLLYIHVLDCCLPNGATYIQYSNKTLADLHVPQLICFQGVISLHVHVVMERILVLKTFCAFYTQYPHGSPSMPMPTPAGPAMYPGMSSQMPPAMPSGVLPLCKKT